MNDYYRKLPIIAHSIHPPPRFTFDVDHFAFIFLYFLIVVGIEINSIFQFSPFNKLISAAVCVPFASIPCIGTNYSVFLFSTNRMSSVSFLNYSIHITNSEKWQLLEHNCC